MIVDVYQALENDNKWQFDVKEGRTLKMENM
jgi:hypothetical protein